MASLSLQSPQIGQPDSTEEPKVVSNFTAIQAWANGRIGTDNLEAAAGITAAQLARAVNDQGGINDGSTVRRGKSIVATEESRTNTAYGTLSTPDIVRSLVLPTDSWLVVAYYALWKEAVSGAARAALFIGSNQVKVIEPAGGTVAEAGAIPPGGATDQYAALVTCSIGLASGNASGAGPPTTVTTGQAVAMFSAASDGQGVEVGGSVRSLTADGPLGGLWVGFAAAGTYDVRVDYKASSGAVTAKERKLWVIAVGF